MKDCFGRDITYLRLSVTERCNLRCIYCMPEEGVFLKKHCQILTQEEMITAVKSCASLGIKKVRITGGEPLVRKNITSLCASTAEIPGIEELCITTNGTLLAPIAKRLAYCGVKRINISIDTLDDEKYSYITRGGKLTDALDGLEAALGAPFGKVKINTVLIKGFNDEEVRNLAMLSVRYPVDVRFIELMPMIDMGPENLFLSSAFIMHSIPDLESLNESDGVSHQFRIPGALGKIGIIPAVSNKFCDSCNRIRITADGLVKPCLHSGSEYSIKGKDETEMKAIIEKAILDKPASRPEFEAGQLSGAKRTMNSIGG